MDPVLVWLIIAAALLAVAAFAPLAATREGGRGVSIALVPLGLLCWVIAEITARSGTMTQTDPRYLTSKTDEHPLETTPAAVEGEHAGIPAGPTQEYLDAEAKRLAADPVGYQGTDYTYNAVPDPVVHEVDTSEFHNMEVPRHDRYADENMPGPTPERVIPGGVTNAHPDFSVSDTGEVGPGHQGLTTTADLSTTTATDEAEEPVRPAGNASTEAWRAYAVSQGLDAEAAGEMTRDELRDLYTEDEG